MRIELFSLQKIKENYYFILYICYIIFVFIPSFRIGIVATLMSIYVLFPRVWKWRIEKEPLVFIFIFWCLLSIVFTDFSTLAISLYIRKIVNFVIPAMFFFVGQNMASRGDENRFYDSVFKATVLCFVFGIFWYITLPDYYVNYLIKISQTSSRFLYSLDPRFSSFIGSIGVGVISNCGLVICANKIRHANKKGKITLTGISLAMISMCLLSGQRSAYVILFFLIIWFFFKFVKNKKKLLVIIASVSFAMIFFYFMQSYDNVDDSFIIERIQKIDVSQMIDSRSVQWKNAFSMLGIRVIWGAGLGQLSTGRAVVGIADGAYFNIIGEVGVIGFVIFALIVLNAILHYWNGQKNTVSMMIVAVFLLNAIGSNGIMYMDLAPLFWFSLGVLCKKNYRKENVWNETIGFLSTSVSCN